MSWEYPEPYDVIVIGGGHAGCESAYVAARMGAKTLLLSMSPDTIAKMSCNPAVGGIGKGHMVREIDAIGGIMGKVTDATGIQFRMLNATKGPAVWAPRAQADKLAYQTEMRHRLERVPNLFIKQGTVEDLLVDDGRVTGVVVKEGVAYRASCVILSSGTFMKGLIHIGEIQFSGGRQGDSPAVGISASLEKLGVKLGRLKTGTPPRIHKRSIDFSLCEEQPGEDGVYFSFDPVESPRLPQISCHITYTTEETKKVILDNLHRSAMYSGRIQGVGPRYCPSIEDKIVRFADKERHQIFLEPEGLTTEEIYVNGVSSSLPQDVQLEYIRSIPALRNAEIVRPAYAIEYDYALSGQITPSLECTLVEGLFFAGQINGTTGYEEAAAQGLVAGINAVLKAKKKPPFILHRSQSYIGVMIDDLVTKGVDEPYRMFTSRAEHRLLLRQDNADLRLREYGYQLGLIDEERYQKLIAKKEKIRETIQWLKTHFVQIQGKGYSLAQVLARPEMNYKSLLSEYADKVPTLSDEVELQVELHVKYEGYIGRQEVEIERQAHIEEMSIPSTFDFNTVVGLRTEAKQKLSRACPITLGVASRIPGISPADITVIWVALKKKNSTAAPLKDE